MLTLLALTALAAPLAEGVVIDPTDPSRAYLMRPEGGIAAVDTFDGRVRWTSTAGQQPLAVAGTALLVTSDNVDHRLTISLLSTSTGRVAMTCGTIALPSFAPGLQEQLGASLRVHGDPVGSALVASWHASTWYSGGAAPPPEIELAAANDAGGALACTTAGGRATDEVPDPGVRGDRAVVGDAEYLVHAGVADGRTGWVWEHRPAAGESRVRFLDDTASWAAVSVDGRHALLSRYTGPGYTTRVLDIASDAVVLEVADLPWGGGFVVTHDRLVVVGSAGLTGLDLATGEPRWTVPVRTLRYDGPYPP